MASAAGGKNVRMAFSARLPIYFRETARALVESAKGFLDPMTRTFYPKEVGDPHTENYAENENVIRLGVPQVIAQIDATVDYIMKGGFYVTVDKKGAGDADKAIRACTDFMKRMSFDTLIRSVIRCVLVYGNAYVEIVRGTVPGKEGQAITDLVLWSPKDIYVKRNESKRVEYYSQWFGKGADFTKFEPQEMAHFVFNRVDVNDAYGTSMVGPLVPTVKHKLSMENAVVKIFKRKAGAPMVINVGSPDGSFVPSSDDLQALANDMAVMKEDTEWVFNQYVKVDAIGFKDKVMDFKPMADYFDMQIMFGGRVPEVILGKGNIPEGLAQVQLDVFGSRCKSIKENVEKELEEKIFRQVLEFEGLKEVPIEFEWGKPSEKEVRDELAIITGMLGMNVTLQDGVRKALSDRVAELMGVKDDADKYQKEADAQRAEADSQRAAALAALKAAQAGGQQGQAPPGPQQPEKEPRGAPEPPPPKESRRLERLDSAKLKLKEDYAPPIEALFIRELTLMNDRAREGVMEVVGTLKELGAFSLKEEVDRKKYDAFIRRIADKLDKSYDDAKEIVDEYIRNSYMGGLDAAESRLESDIGIGTFERQSIRLLQTNGLVLVKDVSEEVKKNIAVRLGQGILAGEGIDDMRRGLEPIFQASRSRLETIARTEVSRAMSEASLNGYTRSTTVQNVEWITARDERTCPECSPLDGRIFTIEGARGTQPAHPNCRCDLLPVIE